MVNYFIIFMLLILLGRQVSLIRKVKIRTKKSKFEIGIFTVSISALTILTIFYAKEYMHYVIAIVAGAFVLINWLKQGISTSGLIIVSKGKEDCMWRELAKVKVKTNDVVNIDYFSASGTKISSHKYDIKHINEILKIFKTNKVKVILNKI